MRYPYKALVLAASLAVLFACKEESVLPQPLELTRESNGHYCGMIIADHPGPKAQVHEKDQADPIWFSSVRDALAYLKLPGEAQQVSVIYVHDMGRAESWEKPQSHGIWIAATKAYYVLGSQRHGGMGAEETVPFLDREAAIQFTEQFGGRVVTFDNIPDAYVLGDGGEHGQQSQGPKPPQS